MQWSLDSEIQALAAETDIGRALASIGLLERTDEDFELRSLGEWLRGGAETYILHLELTTVNRRHRLIMKACVAYPAGKTLSETFDSWLARRARLSTFGVETPHLFGSGNALLLEEYIPLTLPQAIDQDSSHSLIERLGWTYGRIRAAGFVPTSIHDWRSRGSDIVVIDFGQDLGPWGAATLYGMISDLVHQLDTWKIALPSGLATRLLQGYDTALSAGIYR